MARTMKPLSPQVLRAIDEYVGLRLKRRRNALRVSRGNLAEHLDAPRDLVTKYETGETSIPASNLCEAAELLEVPIEYFYDGLDAHLSVSAGNEARHGNGTARKKENA